MAPDACTAAPRAPHGWLHVQDTCRTPPLLSDVRLHDWNSCKAPQHHTHVDHHASVACVATSRAWPLHLVLLCVRVHGLLPCTVTPRDSVDTQLAGQLIPRSEPMQRATSSYSVDLRDFGPSVNISRSFGFIENFHNSEIMSNWKTDETRPRPHKRENLKLGAKWSAGKFAEKDNGKFTEGNPAIDLNPAIDSVGPSSPTPHTSSGTEVGDFGPSGLSVQYTQDIRVSVSTHRTSVAVRVCPCVSVSTHRTSVAVHHTHMTSVGVRQHTQDVCGCLWLSVSTHKTSVAVRVCLCVSVSTHRTSVAVHQYTYQPAVQTGRPWVSVSTHRTSVGVCQRTHDVRGCPSAHTGRPWLSVCVRVCPSAHTGRPWLSISTHINTLVLGLSTLILPVDCSGDFGPRGLSVQYTTDVCGCL
ncbi:hypothetical protein YC2023_108714 [Brassica napus]